MPIYTKTGDKGKTQIFGKRVSKGSKIIGLVGKLDELNCILGECIYLIKQEDIFKREGKTLKEIQKDIFTISSLIVGANLKFNTKKKVKEIEKQIDYYEKELPPLKNFIIPGGELASIKLHLARSVTRNAERKAVSSKNEKFIPYLNRLSDILFVMARWVNFKKGTKEEIWKV